MAKNIKIERIVKISKFIAPENERKQIMVRDSYSVPWVSQKKYLNDEQKGAKKILEQETMKLRSQVYCFMRENWKEINQEEVAQYLPKKLFRDMISFMIENPNLNEKKGKNQENKEAK